MKKKNEDLASFKDPSGFVFTRNGKLLRQVNKIYQSDYDHLKNSGLLEKLWKEKLLIHHTEISGFSNDNIAYKTLEPELIPFISYSYEWCFSQIKDAALITLRIQQHALEHGMSLKDANSFNIQFKDGSPVLIDTLSFERYKDGQPWVAYRQFCENFLVPLALMSYTDVRLQELLQTFVGSIPIDLAVKLLPIKAKLNPGLFIHLFLHAKSNRPTNKTSTTSKSFTKNSFLGLIDNLKSTIENLDLNPNKTVWTNYSDASSCPSYSDESTESKHKIVTDLIKISSPTSLWDLGSNTGNYSRLASNQGIFTISMDSDSTVVEKNYQRIKKNSEKKLLPLVSDLTRPTPAIGWNNEERKSLFSRQTPDCILALALIHHLAIGHNLPLWKLAKFFSENCRNLIIEFVSKEDKGCQLLLENREDVFPNYNQVEFEMQFKEFFTIEKKIPVKGSLRTIYLLTTK